MSRRTRIVATTLVWSAVATLVAVGQACLSARGAGPAAHAASAVASQNDFPDELVRFMPSQHNSLFEGQGPGFWDAVIRERGWILREGNTYHLWYTGYDGTREGLKRLGYATSADGIDWQRSPHNPIYGDHWVEDMMVVKHGDTYYMFAEGLNDEAHLLTSTDRVQWVRKGKLDVRYRDGRPLSSGPYGTPTAWFEAGTWYLFYERGDRAVWLATSKDLAVWTNLQDEPVLEPGPGAYDRAAIALNQIVKHDGRYYAYYHGTGMTGAGREWCTNVAVSEDLVHWKKYSGNPLVSDNQSSGILVHDGQRYRLYTMHGKVRLHLPGNGVRSSDASQFGQ